MFYGKKMVSQSEINKKNKGMSLMELVVAIGILATVAVGILGMFVAATRITAVAHKTTIASFTAQLHMEELIGLTEADLREKLDGSGNPIYWESGDYNGFFIRGQLTFGYSIEDKVYDNLAEAVIVVYDKGSTTSELYTLTDVINIAAGGF